jgi:hypothetical protein
MLIVELSSGLIASVVVIILAYAGFGVWSLVVRLVVNSLAIMTP